MLVLRHQSLCQHTTCASDYFDVDPSLSWPAPIPSVEPAPEVGSDMVPVPLEVPDESVAPAPGMLGSPLGVVAPDGVLGVLVPDS